ncbi:MAG: hypothetical protein SYR96_10110 [Actinomycetota bacterium]|nr:hypothetical protein [Actinomycetota bacterium]
MTRRRLWALITVFCCALLLGGWIVFLARNGLDRSDKWSSVVGAVVTSVLSGLALWAGARPGAGDRPGQVQINQASGNSTMYNVQGGDLNIGGRAGTDET